MTRKKIDVARIGTGVRNFDELFSGGIPKGSVIVLAGPPGSGKTILSQQMCFQVASPAHRILIFNTLSEPTAKTLRYLSQFSFFDEQKLDEGGVQFVDLGVILRTKGLEEASNLVMEEVKKVKPAVVVIDSFRVFDDLARSREESRKFGYELSVNLMAWEVTTFLLGEYGPHDISTNPLFSIVDGLILVTQREQSGEQQRFLQVVKLRGTEHDRDEHAFVITSHGIEVFAPRVTLQREDRGPGDARCKTFVSKLDELLGTGIPRGSSLLIAGVAGTGKTVLLLEFLYRGAQAGEKGIIFSFEETEERLRAAARGLGWDLDAEIARGTIEVVFIAQPNIMVEEHLLMMQERVQALSAQRIAIDSISVFLHKIRDPQIAREKVFQLASIVQNSQAVGFFSTDIPYGANQISRFGVEETVVDGVVLMSSTEEGFERHRYIEVYKLRNTAHLKGRHSMNIGAGGITIYPRHDGPGDAQESLPALEPSRRLSTGVSGLDALCGGGLVERSVTLISGSAGIGKSTFCLQYVLEAAKRKEPSLYVSLEESPLQLQRNAEELGLPLAQAIDDGLCEVVHFAAERVRASQLHAILADKICTGGVRRLVVDGASQLLTRGRQQEDMRQLLLGLVTRFKVLGVTSIVTFEASSMYATGTISDHGLSPIADNIFLLRYIQSSGEDKPTLSVLKTRGSAHDRATYYFAIRRGGIWIEDRVDGKSPSANRSGIARRSKAAKDALAKKSRRSARKQTRR